MSQATGWGVQRAPTFWLVPTLVCVLAQTAAGSGAMSEEEEEEEGGLLSTSLPAAVLLFIRRLLALRGRLMAEDVGVLRASRDPRFRRTGEGRREKRRGEESLLGRRAALPAAAKPHGKS